MKRLALCLRGRDNAAAIFPRIAILPIAPAKSGGESRATTTNPRRMQMTQVSRLPTLGRTTKQCTCTHSLGLTAMAVAVALFNFTPVALAQTAGKQPNILVIMGDDVGWFNIGAYHQGIMSGKTPNLDKLAPRRVSALPTTTPKRVAPRAGRTSLPVSSRSAPGLTTVGQAGADVGLPAEAATLATALKSLGYETGQFGKNHLGDLNKYLADGARLR